jgi:hypothetical protein
MAGRNSIVLRGEYLRKEGKASVTVKPGHLIEWDGTSVATTLGVRPCTKAGVGLGATRKAFALENDIVGQGLTPENSTVDQYDINDTVMYGVFQRGAEIQAWLKTGNNVAIGDALASAGAGNLQKVATTIGADDEEIVAYALEALNNAAGFDKYLRVEVA